MSTDYTCKYCLDDINPTVSTDDIISPCNCKGSMNYVHKTCFSRVTQNSCEICKIDYPESTTTNGGQGLDDDIFRNYIDTSINTFYRQDIDTQINSINANFSYLFVIIYNAILNSSLLKKCLFMFLFMMMLNVFKFGVIGIVLVFTAHTMLTRVLNLIMGNYYTTILNNGIFTIVQYLQYGIVECIYKNKSLIADILSDPISLFLIFLEFKYFNVSRDWWISYEIMGLFNLFLFGYIFLKNDFRALNNYINRNRRAYFNRMRLHNARIGLHNAFIGNMIWARNNTRL